MVDYVSRDKNASNIAFKETIFPEIQGAWFKGGVLIPVESVESPLAEKVDVFIGSDYYVNIPGKGLRGIGNRVQYYRNYKSFTTRFDRRTGWKTEFQKRLTAIEEDYDYPYYTIQSYLNKPVFKLEEGETQKIYNVGMCKTKDLILHIANGEEGRDFQFNEVKNFGAADFIFVNWCRLLEVGIEVKLHKKITIQTTFGNKKHGEAG